MVSPLGKAVSCETACPSDFPYATETNICKNENVEDIDSLAPATCDESSSSPLLYMCNSTCKTQYYATVDISISSTTQKTLLCKESCS